MFENIENIMKIRRAWSTFSGNHPKFAQFLGTIGRDRITEGTVIAVSVTYPDGRVLDTNMRVTESDLELVESLKALARK